jgi:hypothetical protein
LSDENCWEAPQAAAVLKHAVLRAYAPTFTSKTGRFYGDGHVAIVDGYAGPGAYDDGTPGSPNQILRMAEEITERRKVHAYFVEERKSYYDKLKALVDTSSAAGLAMPLHGKCSPTTRRSNRRVALVGRRVGHRERVGRRRACRHSHHAPPLPAPGAPGHRARRRADAEAPGEGS